MGASVASLHLAASEGRVGVERPAVEGEGEEEVVAREWAGGVSQHQLGVVHLFSRLCFCFVVVNRIALSIVTRVSVERQDEAHRQT